MRKLKLDIDIHIDLPAAIDHWCRPCQRVHQFRVNRDKGLYQGDCGATVTFLQLSVEGRLIESKWRGMRRNQ